MSLPAMEKDERIDIRLPASLKQQLGRAAMYAGMPLSAFLLSAASDRARQLIHQQEEVTLTPEDWAAFLRGLDETGKDRPRLKEAARAYAKRVNG
ncbi:MAG: DUF1778 domain-containing protein [Acidithiobacillus caldus]|uniref:type II toxin-antitoxin system TacA family antitoxin n=1 Tax=Acidithiobacillus caldus TaxID=33059 RepID=UPI0028162144|nr:DUF1778 domain-containing protein [Acidithiobacillus caldus]WMT47905.1 MAG: DUF1778 domain-containing protein [Acidithiobacillus caldus]